jgi:hypothetical protein
MRLVSVGVLLISLILSGSATARIVQAPNSRPAPDP